MTKVLSTNQRMPTPIRQVGITVFVGKQRKSDSGVVEKNDAWQLVRLPAHADSRTLDFNVVKVRTKPIYKKRHFFRPTEHSPNCPQAATLKSGVGGPNSPHFCSGVIFFDNTGT